MVFIIKIPNRAHQSANVQQQTDDTTAQLHSSDQAPPRESLVGDAASSGSMQGTVDAVAGASPPVQDGQVQEALDALLSLKISGEGSAHTASAVEPIASSQGGQESKAVEPVPTPPTRPVLDVLVAPAVLAHKYVRGRDISLIVERPERVRAALLGAAAVLGRIETEDEGALAAAGDDLARQMSGMSVDGASEVAAGEHASGSAVLGPDRKLAVPIQLLHSTRSAALHPPHPAVAAVHAYEEESVDYITPECEDNKRKRHGQSDDKPTPSAERILYSDYLQRLCSFAPHSPPLAPPSPPPRSRRVPSTMATSTPTGRTRSSAARTAPSSATTTPAKSPRKKAVADLVKEEEDEDMKEAQKLSSDQHQADSLPPSAPALAPHSHTESEPTTPTRPMPESAETPSVNKQEQLTPEIDKQEPFAADHASGSSSSSEDEGDVHPSEIPAHMPQGDLYLRGTKKGSGAASTDAELSAYGSAEAIRHAIGASIEAVDRVVAGARAKGVEDGSELKQPSSSQLTGDVEPLVFSSAPSTEATGEDGDVHPITATSSLPSTRAFVLTRPPGHHCSGSVPSGFCWVNNAAVAAMHAYQAHGIDRVVIFDIDLHHGNGTQKIAWRINEDTRRGDAEREARLEAIRASHSRPRGGAKGRAGAARKSGGGAAAAAAQAEEEAAVPPRGLQLFYSSLHDIESFPCEDGDPELVRDASVCLEGAHGQWIWNVHLDTYDTPAAFSHLYTTKYAALFAKARNFLSRTGAVPSKTLVLISCGFDACSYEMPGMQRHGRHVPPGFYGRFARDAASLAEQSAEGKIISLLEGGYGDRAIASATIAHLQGLSDPTVAAGGDAASTDGEPWLETPDQLKREGSASPAPASVAHHQAPHELDPYAHAWFAPEALKLLEKKVLSGQAVHALASATSSTATTASNPAWLQATVRHFRAFAQLCEPLMPGFLPPPTGAGSGGRRTRW